jgi:hypothetical protein
VESTSTTPHRKQWSRAGTPLRHNLRNVSVLLLGLALGLAASEALLRARGFRPWTNKSKDAHEPTMHEPDAVLGWRNKQGKYSVPPYHPSGQPIEVTFLDHGRRRTGAGGAADSRPQLVLVGDSFTAGWAISDDETYAWKLQQAFPFLEVLNYGTGGYGTYQSLLMLERELPYLARPAFVLYGFVENAEYRNAAPGSWLGLLSRFSHRGHIDVPFATVEADNRLVRHPPERYLALPFRESSALVAFIEKIYMDRKTRGRMSQKTAVTQRILLEMNKVATQHGATFVVVFLSVRRSTKEHYTAFLRESNIQDLDCGYDITDEMQVPGEGHPNGKMNTRWANCISAGLGEQFEKSR